MTIGTIAQLATPVGPLTVIADGDVVLAAGFTDDRDRVERLIATSLRPAELREADDLGPISRAVDAYFDGDLRAIDAIEVRQRSGAFTERAWQELRRIAPGDPITYGELAKRADAPRAVRAAGQACARNPSSLFVPCHRVVRGDGVAHFYGWGRTTKEWLLAHESTR
jgi:methylated-DNA-[protein]-cysteine S-methyltransferase